MTKTVLYLSPGFPAEMPFFARGLAAAGARVIGIGDQDVRALPVMAKQALADYIRVDSLWDEAKLVEQVRSWARHLTIDQVECLWEPGMIVAARLREALDIPGLTVQQTIPFRDKEEMKKVLERAGIRVPRHHRAVTAAAIRDAAQQLGYPLIVKPIAGAGSADTYQINDDRELEAVIPRLQHVQEVSVEEFIDGEEYTFDTICGGGRILFENVSYYRPRPLVARSVEWVSPQTVCLRDHSAPRLAPGIEMGRSVIRALGFENGFTHMEWFLKPDGEAVFGEIAARPPGARSVDIMNFSSDVDLFIGWAEAVTMGAMSARLNRRFNSAVIFKRASGRGRIQRIEGLERLLQELGPAVVAVDLLPLGAQRRDWLQTLLSDGFVIVRHPDYETLLRIADRVGTDLRIFAG